MNHRNFQGANYLAPMDWISETLTYKPKIIQCIQAYNEKDFIWYTLRSIYDEVDEIRLVEGAVQNQPDCPSDGHSTDGTLDIIHDFIKKEDPDKKVNLIQKKDGPWDSLEEMKQQFLNYAVKGEWNLINDADEIYQKSSIRLLRKCIDVHPIASEFIFNFLHFYGDWQHIAKPTNEWQFQHQRFYRVIPGMKYISHPVVTNPDGRCSFFDPLIQNRRFVTPFYIYHYGYARPNMDENLKQKQVYYNKELSKHGGADKPFDEKVNVFLNRQENINDFCSYPLERHPDIMKGHKMFKYEDHRWKDKKLQDWKCVEPYNLNLNQIGNIHLWMSGLNPRMPFYSNQISLCDIEGK